MGTWTQIFACICNDYKHIFYFENTKYFVYFLLYIANTFAKMYFT